MSLDSTNSLTPPELLKPGVDFLNMDLSALLGEGISRFGEEERQWVEKARRLAVESHEGQRRVSGEPFVVHTIAVARTLVDMGLDWATICAALLHDTIEDTRVTFQELKETFPDPIPNLVSGVTKISSLSFRSSHEEQLENLRKMILAMAKDIRVILIKLADRMHNMSTLEFLPKTKQKRVARATMEIYAPLAGRLGIHRIKSALEDGAMRYLYPEAYHDLREKVASRRADRERHVERSVGFLLNLLAEHGVKAEVMGRSKHFWSIYQKMHNQNLSFEEIYDLNALRVICDTRHECYEIIGLIHSVWKPIPDHFSDYIALPKENLYQSIHTKVIGLDGQITEIQVRTHEMHRIAEEGIAAHWRYKEGKRVSGDDKKLVWLRKMVEWLQDSNDPGEVLHDLRSEAFEDTVFCFSPRGDVIELRRGSTVLDFAYHIHTDLGHHCTGGKVNHKFVPMRTVLKMGDRVEVLVSKTQHPSADWLNIVSSARARSKIRHWLKERDYETNVELGRDRVMRALMSAGVKISSSELRDALDLHLTSFHAKSVDDLFSEVGFGAISVQAVVTRFLPMRREEFRPKSRKEASATVLVDGTPGSVTRFAQCCKPLPGDPILGFVTQGRGISIHHRDCKTLERRIEQSPVKSRPVVNVSWASEEARFKKVALRILCTDRSGVLRDLTDAISSVNINIVAAQSRSNLRNHTATIRFTVLCQDDQINGLMNRLREVPSVTSVTRDSKSR